MSIRFSRLYVAIHLSAVLALALAPFFFFNAYGDSVPNEWKVTIQNGASVQTPMQGFSPDELPILVGDTIVWENNDSFTHSITSGVPEYPEHSGLFS